MLSRLVIMPALPRPDSPPPSVHLPAPPAPSLAHTLCFVTVDSVPCTNMKDTIPLTAYVCAPWLLPMEFSPEAYLAPHKYPLVLQDSAQIFPTASRPCPHRHLVWSQALPPPAPLRCYALSYLWASAQAVPPPRKAILQRVLSLLLLQVSAQPPLLLNMIPPLVLRASFRHFLQTLSVPLIYACASQWVKEWRNLHSGT